MPVVQWVPFASLLVVILIQTATLAFYLGGLAARVRANTEAIDKLQSAEGGDSSRREDLLERVTRLETVLEIQMRHHSETIAGMQRTVEGLSRQVASLAANRKGAVPPLIDAMGD